MADANNPFGPWPMIHVPPKLAEDVLKSCRARLAFDHDLTVKEVETAEWLTHDLTVKELAKLLKEDPSQLEERIGRLYKKLGVKHRSGVSRIIAAYSLMGAKTLPPPPKTT